MEFKELFKQPVGRLKKKTEIKTEPKSGLSSTISKIMLNIKGLNIPITFK